MSTAVIYHWWGNEIDTQRWRQQPFTPVQNLRSPIGLSITTLRAVSTVPIYVIDLSGNAEHRQEWGSLPQELDFTVIPYEPFLSDYSHRAGYRNLSRLFDIARLQNTIPETVIVYADADVFWLHDPVPLRTDPGKFCFDGYNSGFFYYDKNAPAVRKFFELFQAFTVTSLNDDSYRYISLQFASEINPAYYVLDETMLCYMAARLPELFNVIDHSEHLIPRRYEDNPDMDLAKVPFFHANGIKAINPAAKSEWEKNHARGLTCLVIKELYESILSVLGPDNDCFTPGELELFLPKQTSFGHPFLQKLVTTKSASNHYLLSAAVGATDLEELPADITVPKY